jgi:hypothetical protein
MPIVQTIPKLTCNLFQCCKVMEKIPVTNPLLEPPNEFNYRLVYNEDSTSNACLEIYSAYSRNFKNKQDTWLLQDTYSRSSFLLVGSSFGDVFIRSHHAFDL